MEQQDIKIEEIDDPIQYHYPDGYNYRRCPNDIDVPINQLDVKGGDHCPTCGHRPSSHTMLTRKKKHHEECIKKRRKHTKQH